MCQALSYLHHKSCFHHHLIDEETGTELGKIISAPGIREIRQSDIIKDGRLRLI